MAGISATYGFPAGGLDPDISLPEKPFMMSHSPRETLKNPDDHLLGRRTSEGGNQLNMDCKTDFLILYQDV